MTVMQKMGIDPTTKEGMVQLLNIACKDIPDGVFVGDDTRCCKMDCDVCKAERLLAEVPTKKVKRWELYDGDFTKASDDFRKRTTAGCCGCEVQGCDECFAVWLMDDVEVDE